MDYQKLDESRFETRFLQLVSRPRDRDSPMRFDLITASLSDPPRYSALSYHWGTISNMSTIFVEGKPVSIPQNLSDALYHCDYNLIWADCICINQDDLYEKSSQVKLMGQIYSKARKAIVWLGNEHTCTKDAADLLDILAKSDDDSARRPPKFKVSSGSSSFSSGSSRNMDQKQAQFSRALRDHARPPRAMKGLYELLSRPYWQRIWIVQEIAKAYEVVVVCGGLQLDLDDILFWSSVVSDLPSQSRTLFRSIANFRTQEQRTSRGGPRKTLLQALIMTRHCLATDLRDKVYALLGLARDGPDLVPFPTYTEDVQVIFQRLTVAMIRLDYKTNVILLPRWAPLLHSYPTSTKWAIDWADLAFNVPPWLTQNTTACTSISGEGSFRDGKLYTRGRLIAPIENVQSVGSMAPASPCFTSDKYTVKIMNNIREDILERLSPGDAATDGFDDTTLTDVLSRMLRDADKGFAASNYNFHRVQDVLERLGKVMIDDDPVCEWARNYNASRATSMRYNEGLSSTPNSRERNGPNFSKQSHKRDGKRTLDPRRTPSSKDPMPSPAPSLPSLSSFRVMEDIIANLDEFPEYKLRFCLCLNRLIMTCDKALPGDNIYEIEHCQLPVVLRETPYEVLLIGEACLGRNSDGEWLSPSNRILSSTFNVKTPWKRLTIELEAQKRTNRRYS